MTNSNIFNNLDSLKPGGRGYNVVNGGFGGMTPQEKLGWLKSAKKYDGKEGEKKLMDQFRETYRNIKNKRK